jgi:DNA-binding ferritin-like protein (Dps family)
MEVEKLVESLKKMIQEKAEYKAYRKLIETLPEDYQFVSTEIEKYLFNVVGDAAIMPVLMDTIESFAIIAQNGRSVFSITGNNVGSFCDNLVKKSNIKTLAERQNNRYIEVWNEEQREKLNKKIQKRFGGKLE